MLMRMSEKQQKKKLLNYIRLVGKYALIVAKLMLAIPMLIVRQPVQKKDIGEKCCFSLLRRKNGFASNLLSANMMQICVNWEIYLSKGGKCRIRIPIYTTVQIAMQNRHLPPLLRLISQFAQICIIFALSKFEANPFFRPVESSAGGR